MNILKQHPATLRHAHLLPFLWFCSNCAQAAPPSPPPPAASGFPTDQLNFGRFAGVGKKPDYNPELPLPAAHWRPETVLAGPASAASRIRAPPTTDKGRCLNGDHGDGVFPPVHPCAESRGPLETGFGKPALAG